MVGTAVNSTSSSVYFTGYEGNVSEIYYPTVDTLATSNLEFLVGDAARTFLDEEKSQSWTVTQPDRRSMRWLAVTSNAGHNWQIAKTIFADPSNNTLIQETTFEALNGKTVGDFNLYLLYKPYLKNVAANNSAMTVASGGNAYLVASSGDGSEFSALGASLGWTMQNNVAMASNGYYAVNDGWQDLFVNNPNPFSMRWAYSSASKGNVAQMGWLSTAGNSATAITFVVAVGFGATQADAIAAVSSTLGEDISVQQGIYDNAWHDYDAALSDQSGTADDQYYLSAMTLKTMQDKSNGAMIAGIGTPWGFASGDGKYGYHLVWSRDMYKFANALITAGDSASAASAVNWLFNHDIDPSAGHFPQNAFVNGTPFGTAVQMDEQAMPIVLAYRLGPAVYNPLWPQIQKIANFIYSAGPWTEEERWEETSGYSPSTIAAEIAGLVDAAQIALANNDPADAANWLNAADYWQQNIAGWTYTGQGCPNVNSNCNSTQMYMRINTSGAQVGSPPGSWNPTANPNPDMIININNNGGAHRAIDIVDGGFLELVRMGVKRPNDPTIINSLAAYDSVIEETIGANANPAWFRYNFDGYGETNAGGPFQDGAAGRGRLWPIFDAERGNYEIAAKGNGAAGAPYLAALKAFSTPQGFISEQIFNPRHAAGGQRNPVRLGRNPSTRRDPRRRHGLDGAAQLGARGIHQSVGGYRRRQGARHPAGRLLPLLRLPPHSGAGPGRGRYQRHRAHAVGPVHVRHGRHAGARQLEPQPRSSGRFRRATRSGETRSTSPPAARSNISTTAKTQTVPSPGNATPTAAIAAATGRSPCRLRARSR